LATGARPLTGCAFWDESAPGLSKPGVNGQKRAANHPDDDDPESLIPAGVQTVIDVNMGAVRRSAWVAPALEARDPRARAAKEEALGYDDVRDVDRIIYAVTSAGADAPTLVIAQGRFTPARIEEAFRTRWPGAVVERWRGVSILASGENALALLTVRTFAAGPPTAVHAAIDRAFGLGPDVGADPAIGPTRRALCPPGRDASPAVLALVAVDARMRARVGDAVPVPSELRQVGMRLDLGQSLDLSALGIMEGRDAAAGRAAGAALARRLNALIADPVTRMMLRPLGLGMVLAGTRVTADGARVLVRASIADEYRAPLSSMLRTWVESSGTGAAGTAGTGAGPFGSW
jgi:hypothetical protein